MLVTDGNSVWCGDGFGTWCGYVQDDTKSKQRRKSMDRSDSDRLNQLEEMLLVASSEISNEIGLPRAWGDIREALDELYELKNG